MSSKVFVGAPKIFLCSLGCSKNEVDSQRFASIFASQGAQLVDTPQEADWGFVNTCGFIVPAIEESLQAIFHLEDLKKKGVLSAIGVIGCLYNRFGESLREDLPQVDFWISCEGWSEARSIFGENREFQELPSRLYVTGKTPWVRSLKILEGCDNRCTYCTIPSIRGGICSVPLGGLLGEARHLVEEGAREICVIAQDITKYGEDRGNVGTKKNLLDLLAELSHALPKDIWLRCLYLHPQGLEESFWEKFFALPQVIPYVDIPVQHGSEKVLARMNRKDSRKRLEGLFESARKVNPSVVFRTTIMVGFPGEDEDSFEELLDFLERVRFHRLGCFVYFPEEGTPAASFSDQVAPEEAQDRMRRVMELQERISLEHQEKLLGKELEVVVERQEENIFLGRSYREAPDVDGEIEILPLEGKRVLLGNRVKVRITDAWEHDLRGTML